MEDRLGEVVSREAFSPIRSNESILHAPFHRWQYVNAMKEESPALWQKPWYSPGWCQPPLSREIETRTALH